MEDAGAFTVFANVLFAENIYYKQWGLGNIVSHTNHAGSPEIWGNNASDIEIARTQISPVAIMYDRASSQVYYDYFGPTFNSFKIDKMVKMQMMIFTINSSVGLFVGI